MGGLWLWSSADDHFSERKNEKQISEDKLKLGKQNKFHLCSPFTGATRAICKNEGRRKKNDAKTRKFLIAKYVIDM